MSTRPGFAALMQEQVLSVLFADRARSTASVAAAVGRSHKSALSALKTLTTRGDVVRVQVDGRPSMWLLSDAYAGRQAAEAIFPRETVVKEQAQ